jgi:hypothetical protein
MSEEKPKQGEQPKNQPREQPQKIGWVNEGFNKAEKGDIGGGRADSGDYGRGHTKPPRPKEEEGK